MRREREMMKGEAEMSSVPQEGNEKWKEAEMSVPAARGK